MGILEHVIYDIYPFFVSPKWTVTLVRIASHPIEGVRPMYRSTLFSIYASLLLRVL